MQKATLAALPEGSDTKAGVYGTFLQNIMLRNPKTGYEFHVFLTLDGKGDVLIFYAHRKGKSQKAKLTVSDKVWRAFRSESEDSDDWVVKARVGTQVSRLVHFKTESGYDEFGYNEIDSSFDPTDEKTPEYLRSYLKEMLTAGIFGRKIDTLLGEGVGTLVDASALTGKPLRRRFCEIPSKQDWLAKNYPDLTDLPAWNPVSGMAIR